MIQRSFDYRRVNRITSWPPLISRDIIYLIEKINNKDVGVWSFREYFDESVLIHADMTTECRGQKAVESMKEAFKWIFENTGFKTIYAKISTSTKIGKAACHLAKWAGMRFDYAQNGERYYQVNKNEFCS